jgi:tetratricopeptide (TPR) repeat protein
MGQAYAGLGLYKPAGDLLGQAREDQQSGAVSDESRVRTLVATGLTLYLAGKYEAAESPLREAVNLARTRLDPSNPLRSAALTNLADVLVQLGKYAEAEQLCREALAADRKRGPAGEGVLASTLSSLASAYFYQGDLAAADGPMHEALELNRRAYGMQDAHTAMALNNLAGLLFQSGKYEEAYADYEQALPLYRAVFGENHPEVSTLLNNLGRTALLAGHLNEAEPILRQALAMTEQFMGSDHDYLVAPLNSLAMIDAYLGRMDEANSEIHRADKIARLPDHGELLDQVLLNEADLAVRHGDRARASAMLDESKKLLQQAHVNDSANAWRYAVWDTVDAELLALSGDAAGAARVLAAAQPIIVQRFGVNGFYSLLVKRQALWIANAPKAQQ